MGGKFRDCSRDLSTFWADDRVCELSVHIAYSVFYTNRQQILGYIIFAVGQDKVNFNVIDLILLVIYMT